MSGVYDIKQVAADLGLEPENLKEVFEIYFQATPYTIDRCRDAWQQGDIQVLANLFHGLKGSSNNLRIDTLGELALQGEMMCREHELQEVAHLITDFHREFMEIKRIVEEFYKDRFLG